MSTFTFDDDILEQILTVITSDEKKDELLDVLFKDDDKIDKTELLDFLKRTFDNCDSFNVKTCIDIIANNPDAYGHLLIKLQEMLISQLTKDMNSGFGTVSIASIDSYAFWTYYTISVKKCLGIEHAGDKLSEIIYFRAISPAKNKPQKECQTTCLESFNFDAINFSIKDCPTLRVFIHKFHSKNKRLKTRKKNLRRVQRRARKILQISKLAHNGKSMALFSQGRHVVVKDFADAIVKIYF